MEKLKNLINPGHKKDEEVLYGSGQSDDPVHTGHGHHAGKVEGNPLTSNKTVDDTGPTTSFSGYGGAPVPGSNRAPEDRELYDGSKAGTTGGSSSSRMPGGFDDDTATTASVKSGVVGEPQIGSTMSGSNVNDPPNTNKALPREPESAGIGYATGAAGVGPHSSSLANKADPRVDSDLDGSRGLGSGTSGAGSGLTGTSLPDRSVGSSGYGRDSTTGSSHLGRDTAIGAGALGAGEAAHHHREKQDIGTGSGREFPLGGSSTTSTSGHPTGTTGSSTGFGLGSTTGGYGSGTGPTASSANTGSLGSDIPMGAYNEESWTHDHGHDFKGDPCGPGSSAPGAPHFTKGPHALDTANRLDPRVSGGIAEPTGSTNTGGSSTTGSGLGFSTTGPGLGSSSTGTGLGSYSTTETGLGSSSSTGTGLGSSSGTGLGSSTTGTGLGSSSTGDRHLGRDAALAGGVGAAGVGAYESSRDGSGSTTAGPHKSSMMNKMDPRVDSDLSKQQGTSSTSSSGLGHGTSTVGLASGVSGSSADGTALPSDNKTSGLTTGRDHHYGRDAGVAGAGAAGLGAYEAEKHHRGQGPTGMTSGSTSDPYSSSGMDPRIESSTRSETSGLTDAPVGSKDHHYGRDAGLAGAGGLAAYEGGKHLGGKYDPSQTGTSSQSTGYGTPGQVLYDSGSGPTTSGHDQQFAGAGPTSTAYGTPGQATSGYDQQQTGSGHHLGRDVGLVGAGGVGAYEAEKHLGRKEQSRDGYGADPAATSTGQPTGHHYGRDAALGAGGVGAGTAAYEAEKHHGTQQPMGTSSAYDNQQNAPTHSHTGRDAALAGGAGLGAGAVAGSEFSKKEAEQELKDQKAQEKEIAKEQKQHHKELEKDHKHHQKEVEKEQKHHQKEIEKMEKKHEKEVEKGEKHEEKKHHGGILGLFKRDKPDEELKRENMERKGELPPHGAETAAGVGAAGAGVAGISDYEQHERAGEHQGMSEADKLMQAREHDRNRLHKDPPPGYIEQKMEHSHGGSGMGSSATGRETLPDGRVIEPHTGLPVDLSKGDGSGGIDNQQAPGIHSHHH